MLSARNQTHHDNARRLIEIIRKTKCHGRHDGIGNSVISIDLYQHWALDVAEAIEWLLANTDSLGRWQPTTTEQIIHGPVPNPIDMIARSKGWLPLSPGESMSVGFNGRRYKITREE